MLEEKVNRATSTKLTSLLLFMDQFRHLQLLDVIDGRAELGPGRSKGGLSTGQLVSQTLFALLSSYITCLYRVHDSGFDPLQGKTEERERTRSGKRCKEKQTIRTRLWRRRWSGCEYVCAWFTHLRHFLFLWCLKALRNKSACNVFILHPRT